MSKHERFTTAVNDSTGDLIKTKPSNQQAYADNWERIFGKTKADEHPHGNSGVRYTGMTLPEPIPADEALQKLINEGKLSGKAERRYEEQNSGKGLVLADPIAVWEEEFVTRPFLEEGLPEGMIEDEL